jgi:hypothetical protein
VVSSTPFNPQNQTPTTGVDTVGLVAKQEDVVALNALMNGSTDYTNAASLVFRSVLQPYYNAAGDAQAEAAILAKLVFSCSENVSDPTSATGKLAFPFDILAPAGTMTWHRYSCTFTLTDPSTLGSASPITSPVYTFSQLDIRYQSIDLEPAVAFQNYNLGTASSPNYDWMGKYVQPLNLMLRDNAGNIPANAVAGVNGGYDYRVDSWSGDYPQDAPCSPRYALDSDRYQFYTHPVPRQCSQTANNLPSCATGDTLPITDDMGDSLVYLSSAVRSRSWRTTPFQSYNCGSLFENMNRGALIMYPSGVFATRTSPSKDNVQQLMSGTPENALSAQGGAPLLIQYKHFVYDQSISEEGSGINSYEIGGQTGVGYQVNTDGSTTLHMVGFDGEDYLKGLHLWIMGLYFLSPYAASDGAIALSHGGDATMWINPQTPSVQAVLANPADPNNAFFHALFASGHNPGIVSNCSGFNTASFGCGARPVHDGLFVYLPQ